MLVGITVSTDAAATPVPVSEIACGDPVAFVTKFTLPEALPAADGVNFTEMLRDCPAFTVAGVVIAVRLNPVPVAEALLRTSAAPPGLEITTVRGTFPPTATLPKSTDDGENEICGWGVGPLLGGACAPVRPMQPTWRIPERIAAPKIMKVNALWKPNAPALFRFAFVQLP
jgi:hypothetical protein